MNNELKIKYKNDFNKVRLLMNEFNPCGLIEGGAPIDEYDRLTDQVLSHLHKKKGKEKIKQLIFYDLYNVFEIPDIENIEEPYKMQFYTNLEKFLVNLEKVFS